MSDEKIEQLRQEEQALAGVTRRHFFEDCRLGLGKVALASLMGTAAGQGALSAATTDARNLNPLAPQPGHHPAKAKSVIYLFMAGGPS